MSGKELPSTSVYAIENLNYGVSINVRKLFSI